MSVSAFSLISLLVSISEALILILGRVGRSVALPFPFSSDVYLLIFLVDREIDDAELLCKLVEQVRGGRRRRGTCCGEGRWYRA